MELELITEFKEAESNAMLFSNVGDYPDSNVFQSLGKFFHWYYFPRIDIFAPRKFIRYRRSSIEEYDSSGTGSDSSNKNMEPWFHKLDRKSQQYRFLLSRLESYLKGFDKRLSDKTKSGTGGIYVPREHFVIVDYPDQVTSETYLEGSVKSVLVNAYERNPKARIECIRHWGAVCWICECDFKKRYGDIGNGFIHVHHLKEISEIRKEYEVDPVNDLRPLCPNCHAMIHRKKPALQLEELKEIYQMHNVTTLSGRRRPAGDGRIAD